MIYIADCALYTVSVLTDTVLVRPTSNLSCQSVSPMTLIKPVVYQKNLQCFPAADVVTFIRDCVESSPFTPTLISYFVSDSKLINRYWVVLPGTVLSPLSCCDVVRITQDLLVLFCSSLWDIHPKDAMILRMLVSCICDA